MSFKTHQVVCTQCKGQRVIQIHDTPVGKRIDWLEDKQEEAFTIISGRERLDGQWGWECICGHKTIDTPQELRVIADKASPKPQEITEIMKNIERAQIKDTPEGLIVDGFILKTL